eukprot:Nitzschia sp. Nitz4//scaffold189_size62959//37418//38228//NITZ4_006311-RA/size62959-snap-gene-0.9-mRNA-1//-1//CDS//3329539905//6021//frame0
MRYLKLGRTIAENVAASKVMKRRTVATLTPCIDWVDASHAPSDFTSDCAVVYPNFLTPEEGEMISSHVLTRLKRRRYEKGHWDSVIVNYKEVELYEESLDQDMLALIARVRDFIGEHHIDYKPISWLPCHAIDYKKDGELNAHVDSIKFSGDIVSGVSLLSPATMRLVPDDAPEEGHVDIYLPPLSLYALTGVGRYRYSHELLQGTTVFSCPSGEEITVQRDHRLSIIFRDAKPPGRD